MRVPGDKTLLAVRVNRHGVSQFVGVVADLVVFFRLGRRSFNVRIKWQVFNIHPCMIPVVKRLKNFYRLDLLILGKFFVLNNEGDSRVIVYFVRNVFGVALTFF
jgi:hypothetical protein